MSSVASIEDSELQQLLCLLYLYYMTILFALIVFKAMISLVASGELE